MKSKKRRLSGIAEGAFTQVGIVAEHHDSELAKIDLQGLLAPTLFVALCHLRFDLGETRSSGTEVSNTRRQTTSQRHDDGSVESRIEIYAHRVCGCIHFHGQMQIERETSVHV